MDKTRPIIFVMVAVALYFSFVVFNNLTDYATNARNVNSVLSMEQIKSDGVKWRAISNPVIIQSAYHLIILIEALTAAMGWSAVFYLQVKPELLRGHILAVTALALGFALFFIGFFIVGGEWFYMWQHPLLGGLQTKALLISLFLLTAMVFVINSLQEPQNG